MQGKNIFPNPVLSLPLVGREKNPVMIPCSHAHFCDPCGQDLIIMEQPEPRCPLCCEPVEQCHRQTDNKK